MNHNIKAKWLKQVFVQLCKIIAIDARENI